MSTGIKYKLLLKPEVSTLPPSLLPELGVSSLNGISIQPRVDVSGNIEMPGNFLVVKNIEAGVDQFTTNTEKGIINVYSDSTTSGVSCINFMHNIPGGNNRRYCSFQSNNSNSPPGVAGSITGNPAQVSYNTMSDGRLKTIISSIDSPLAYKYVDANSDSEYNTWLDAVNMLNPITYKFTATGYEQFKYKLTKDAVDSIIDYQGFIASEVQGVYPPAVTGISGETIDIDGTITPVYQHLDMSKLIPMMVGAIKELSARVVALELELRS
tara:strand:- start:115 stop:918 length:804 start_codon:yes stop_codon:yes gene_type:complete